MFKVIHVPFCFYPDPVGGTEVYVASLARDLESLGIENVIVAPAGADSEANAEYQHNGLRVRRYAGAAQSTSMLSEVYGEGDPIAASRFAQIVDEEQPDVVHMHALTRAVSLLIAREVKRRGIRLVFTYHTPTVSCMRGTLMRGGSEVCDGILDRRTCARCTLQSYGVNGSGGRLLSVIPAGVGRALGTTGFEGKLFTALRMTELVELRHQTFRNLMNEVDTVVALCQWTRDLLVRNGVAPEKIVVSRHGLADHVEAASVRSARDQGPLRIAFLGRLDRTKGPDILINAVRLLPQLDVTIDFYGITQAGANDSYVKQLKSLAGNDPRFSFRLPVPAEEIVGLLRQYDLLAVPSRWLETGPLVVLEAFAAGTPVIGSNLGGIAELIQDGRNGVLVEDESPITWARILNEIANDPALLKNMTESIKKPRTMRDVADDVQEVYSHLRH